MDNDSVNGVYIESSNMPSKFSPSVNDYGQTYINLNSNEGNNSNYVVRDKNGNVFSGNVSPESILIHEIQHAYDNSRLSTDEYNRQATPGSGQTGEDSTILDDRAIEEANKYRREKGEPERIWYNDIKSYNKYHE